MQRPFINLFLLLCIGLQFCSSDAEAALFSWGNESLLKIDSQEYTSTDFKNWWENWREKDQPFPQNLDPYIDWLLFVKEAEKMMLFDDPAYHRDVNTYLKVLSLVQLKNDEIDSKIQITDKVIREHYNKFYIPLWSYHIVVVKDMDTAEVLYTDLAAGVISVEELSEFSVINKPVPPGHPAPENNEVVVNEKMKVYTGLDSKLLGVHQNVQRRPVKSEEAWVKILEEMDKGDFSRPFAWQEGFVIVQLIDRSEGDDADFKKLEKTIQTKYRKGEQGRLTYDLIQRLKEKFGVTINDARISEIDPDSPDMKYTDAVLVTIGDMSITEAQVMEKVNNDIQMNRMYGFTGDSGKDVLRRVVDGIIGQTLITIEALDRHYEKTSPIKELVEFKEKHKLVQKLEQQIRDQVMVITDEDVTGYYKEHQEEFTGPEIYKMALMKGSEETLNKLWLDVVINGNDIMEASEKRLGARPVIQSYPADHLEEKVLQNARSMNNGDISRAFPLKDEEGFAMIYLIAYSPSEVAPQENVKQNIQGKIFQNRYADVRDTYIDDLRKKAEIEINEKAWTKLKAELIKEND